MVEAQDGGLTRLEISYRAKTTAVQQFFYAEDFETQVRQDLDRFHACLNRLKGVCFRLPHLELFRNFLDAAHWRQVYIQQPYLCALIFARNGKKGCYTGIWQTIPKSGPFNREHFLAAHALPGHGSKIYCDVLARGVK